MTPKKDEILQFVRGESAHPMKTKELARAMDVDQSDYSGFRRNIKELIDEGSLVRLKRGRVGPADQMDILVGTISVNRAGTGFLERADEDDILIPNTELQTALDGDKVMVRLTGQRYGRQAGTVIKVVERMRRRTVGVFKSSGGFYFVKPDSGRIHRDFYIHESDTDGAKDGQKVVVELVEWEDPHLNPKGRVAEVLGYPHEPGVDMLTVIKEFDLPEEFSDKIIKQAEEFAAVDTSQEEQNRVDLTKELTYTIDPADAKDHDDAISIERIGNGYRLGVHIADVSYFVKENSALDKEAFGRGNSVYLPGMVIPMIPEVLSNDVCSLRPNRRRLAHSVFIEFDKVGVAKKWWLEDTVIRSRAKLAYEEVQEFFDTGKATRKIKPLASSLKLARELARHLQQRRSEEGSLDFDLPEAKIILNEKGEVIELGNRVRLEAHRLVEEFMLAANRAVAIEVFRKGQPFLYRVHAKPDMEKLNSFSYMMERLGYHFPVSETMRPIQFRNFLERVKDAPEADFINELMLRSMQKAVYQRDNIGHFGLAFKHYTHFTSPIRRYPDLLVHRMLRMLRGRETYPHKFAKRAESRIDSVGEHCSETERIAESAERQAVKVKQTKYMADHLGDEYNGVITGVTPSGFFVRLENMGVEGMVRISSVDDDYYHYDEKHYRFVGRRTNRSFRLGDAVRVGVEKVDTVQHQIDLYLPEGERRKKKGGPKGKGKAKQSARRKGRKRTTKSSGGKDKPPKRKSPKKPRRKTTTGKPPARKKPSRKKSTGKRKSRKKR